MACNRIAKNRIDEHPPPVAILAGADPKDALKEGTLVIDQIEYTDGAVWKKTGWNYRLPAGSLQKLAEGSCSVF